MGFVSEHKLWLDRHLQQRSGERKGRLKRGHGHGERLFLKEVWWPMFGHFHHLHPEFEVADWRGHPYFIDFAWIQGSYRFAFEIKGYGAHVQNTDRVRYRRELNREIFLQSLGFRVVSIPYDELELHPNMLIFLLKSLLMPYVTAYQADQDWSPIERQAWTIILRYSGAIRPIDLANDLQIDRRTAIRCLQSFVKKGIMKQVATKNSIRVTKYERIRSLTDETVW